MLKILSGQNTSLPALQTRTEKKGFSNFYKGGPQGEGQLLITGVSVSTPRVCFFRRSFSYQINYQRFCHVGLKLRKPREYSDYLDKFKIFISFYRQKIETRRRVIICDSPALDTPPTVRWTGGYILGQLSATKKNNATTII